MSYEVVRPVWSQYIGQSGFGAISAPAGFDPAKPWAYCGSQAVTSQMLKDLGYPGSINVALSNYAKSKGMSVSGGVTAAVCQAILTDWIVKQTPAAPPPASPPPETGGEGKGSGASTGGGTGQQAQQQVVVSSEASMTDKALAWWKGLPTAAKVGVGVGSVAAVGALFWLLIPGKKKSMPVGKYESSVEYTTGTPSTPAAATPNPKAARLPRVKGKPFGHLTAPKKYRRLGFTKPGHYAWPYGFSYPIGDAKHTRLASQRFSMHKSRYPKFARATIARRIDMAKKYFGIAEYRGMGTMRKKKRGRGKVQFAVRKAA